MEWKVNEEISKPDGGYVMTALRSRSEPTTSDLPSGNPLLVRPLDSEASSNWSEAFQSSWVVYTCLNRSIDSSATVTRNAKTYMI